MLGQLPHIAPIVLTNETVIYDGDEEVARITGTDITIRQPDGALEQRKLHDNLVLVDGTNFNAAMMFGTPRVDIGVCRLCRRPPYTFPFCKRPTHGLVRLARAKACVCGTLCCPKHRHRCADGRYRCPKCTWRWRLRQCIVWIFCVQE